MAKTFDIDQLRKLLAYDPETGVFTWLPREECTVYDRKWNAQWAGAIAGLNCDRDGYLRTFIKGRHFQAHRVAWAISYGYWPAEQIDHIDGDRANNRLANLREATPSQNSQNIGFVARNTSGFHGVGWHAQAKKWQAQIRCGGKNKYLGLFDEPHEAYAVYLAAKARLHPFHPVPRDVACSKEAA